MPTPQKEQVVQLATDWYQRSSGLIFTDYRGLKVQEISQLRNNLRKKGAELHVLKNTLFRLAAGEDAAKFPEDLHSGPTAVVFVFQDEAACAKEIFDFAKTNKQFQVKGGYVAGKVFSAKQMEELSKLPPKEVLIAQVIGAISAPLTQLVSTVEALYAQPIRTIGAVADKVAEGK
jgi:large subunit ribosomal protein L10